MTKIVTKEPTFSFVCMICPWDTVQKRLGASIAKETLEHMLASRHMELVPSASAEVRAVAAAMSLLVYFARMMQRICASVSYCRD